MHYRSILALVPAALLAAAAGLHAQGSAGMEEPALSQTRGFEVGLHVNGAAIYPNDGQAEGGFGGGLRLGYGANDQYTVFSEADAASIQVRDGPGSYTLVHLGIGVRRSFGALSEKTRPYGEAALVGVGVSDDVSGHSVRLTGGSIQFGLGIEHFISRHAAVDLGVEMGPGRLTNASVDGDATPMDGIGFTTIRLNVGFTFHP